MRINLSINLSEYDIEEMYNVFCQENECSDCGCQTLIDECYEGCLEKYKDLYLRSDIQYKVDQLFR